MKLARLGPEGQETPVVVTDHGTYDLSGVVYDLTGEFFASGGLDRVARRAGRRRAAAARRRGLRVGAPVARPSAVICIGMNYAAHAAESGADAARAAGAVPQDPEHRRRARRPGADPARQRRRPTGRSSWPWSSAAGPPTSTPPRESLDHVAGFTVCDDLSERAFQLEVSGGQWSKGKACRGLLPDRARGWSPPTRWTTPTCGCAAG